MKKKLPFVKTRILKPLKNWKIKIYPTLSEYNEEFPKIKNLVYFTINVPEKFVDTLDLLFYKIQRDLKIINIDDIAFVGEKNDLPKVKQYLDKYYDGYIKYFYSKQYLDKVRKWNDSFKKINK